MALQQLYHPESGRMRIAGFMSGSGSNLRKILETEKRLETQEGYCPYKVVVIFSDNPSSNASRIAEEYQLPCILSDIQRFYDARKRPRRDMHVREKFDFQTLSFLEPYDIDVLAFAGYMSIASPLLVRRFLGVNVHPADLSVRERDLPKYNGAHAVRDAILAGEHFLSSSTHMIEEKVDQGKILMISKPLEVRLDGVDLRNKKEVQRVAEEH